MRPETDVSIGKQVVSERNNCILMDHNSGKDPGQLAREHGLSRRRIQQILNELGVRKESLKNRQKADKSSIDVMPVSKLHAKIGLIVYQFRYDRNLSAVQAAEEIGWSMRKLRSVEQGLKDITLLDIQDIAAYLKMDPADFWRSNVSG